MPVSFNALQITQTNHSFWLTSLPASILAKISYAAVRGKDDEEGAVQRALNPQRIASLKEFAMRGGDYPVTVVLNWISPTTLSATNGRLEFEPSERVAQIIDGQHRIAGLAAAIEENGELGELRIPVAVYVGLTTQQCADIFLAINTEQRPAPRSLVYDLFGIAQKAATDVASIRARDIAIFINEAEGSPYYREIKMPGEKVRRGGVALSTAVAALKPLVEANGHFDRAGLRELEIEQVVVLNFLAALRNAYGSSWESKDNAFKYASGFTAAMQFLANRIIPYCKDRKSFKSDVIRQVLGLDFNSLIFQSELKGLGGSEAVNQVYERLNSVLSLPREVNDVYEF